MPIVVVKATNVESGGCVVSGEMPMVGSNFAAVDADVQTRLQTLMNQINDPDSFTGTLENALDQFFAKLTSMIAKPKSIVDADYSDLNRFLSASLDGSRKVLEGLKKGYPTPIPAVIQKRIDDIGIQIATLEKVSEDLKKCKKSDCSVDLSATKKATEALKTPMEQFEKETDFIKAVLSGLKTSGQENFLDVSQLFTNAKFSGDQINPQTGEINIYYPQITLGAVPFKLGLFSLSKPYKINLPLEYAEDVSGAGIYAATGNRNLLNGFGITGDKANIQSLWQWLKIPIINIMIFSNGYRGPQDESIESIDKAELTDTKNYWDGIDFIFKDRRNPSISYYVDGHKSITTSNHNNGSTTASMIKFTNSMVSSLTTSSKSYNDFIDGLSYLGNQKVGIEKYQESCYHNANCVFLNTISNNIGFNYRKEKGKIAGQDILLKLKNLQPDKNITYNVDIVAHSMGFAYAQGIVEELKKGDVKIKFDGYYIIAPENACGDSIEPVLWKEIWHYGSDLGQPNSDPLWEQDGVAPQCPIGGLDSNRRIFIPKNKNIPKGFVESHSISNYFWIKQLKDGEKGGVSIK